MKNKNISVFNKAVIGVIVNLLKTYKELSNYENPDKKALSSLQYLIGQLIRAYNISEENYHISKAAIECWEELSNESIRKYSYRQKVKCDKLTKPTTYYLYKGAQSKPSLCELKPNDKFTFRDIFHEEHIIPVSLIRDEMLNHKIDKKNVKSLLDSMHICIILKEEDRKIGRTGNRSINFKQVIKDVYNKKGIELVNKSLN